MYGNAAGIDPAAFFIPAIAGGRQRCLPAARPSPWVAPLLASFTRGTLYNYVDGLISY